MAVDRATQAELKVQAFQALYHLATAFLIVGTTDPDVLQSPLAYVGQMKEGVHPAYLVGMAYHGTLYFRDPVTATPVRWYHMLATLVAPALLAYGQLAWLVGTLVVCWLLDVASLCWRGKRDRMVVAAMTKVHHLVTVLILSVSWLCDFTSIGLFVMFIHDVSDVPMFMVRMVRKMGAGKVRQAFAAAVTVALWAYYRVYLFGLLVVAIGMQVAGNELPAGVGWQYGFCGAGLLVLFSFNVYWTALVVFKCVRELCCGYDMSIKNE